MGTIFTFNVLGYPVAVTGSALLMFIYLVYGESGSVADISRGLIWASVLFFSVLVHELGHAVAADRLGLRPLGIVLHGFGGLCQYGRSPNPKQGLVASAAGPVAGLLLALVAFVLTLVLPKTLPVGVLWMVQSCFQVSLFLNLMNLLPMYPLDGGHVLHSGLSIFMRGSTAWRVTKWVSVPTAVVVGLGGLYLGFPFLAFMAALSLYQTLTR
jgi:Zn-dependent protease